VRTAHIALGFAGFLFGYGVLCHFVPPGRFAPEFFILR
jgi:hypothetical protein